MPHFGIADIENVPPPEININVLHMSPHKQTSLAAVEAAASAKLVARHARQQIAGLDGYLQERRTLAEKQKVAAAVARRRTRKSYARPSHWTSAIQWEGEVQDSIGVYTNTPLVEQVHWSETIIQKDRRIKSIPKSSSLAFEIYTDHDIDVKFKHNDDDEITPETRRELLDLEIPGEHQNNLDLCQSMDRISATVSRQPCEVSEMW
eukprot:CAMPEP_0169072458 /NCGR_PEP_ID=MMETSP1015-20121227/6208_1 /TAXON_ID=342587 /ORGANISM="Karlodinium micrum, Strain CCMP2283" /LENGTH=205 /DNA_ID=CAMNT_0009131621 /DNA_START=47 /DNA_END=661 /DNA_ORIENTATION=+